MQRPIVRLALVGVGMLALAGLGLASSVLWLPAVVLGVTGIYLVAWAAIGRGRWCRGCKRFDGISADE